MSPLAALGWAALAWVALHVIVAGSGVRSWLVARVGEGAFRGIFSLLSLVSLVCLIAAYRRAPCVPLWMAPRALLWLPLFVMPPAFVLLVGAFSVRNPTGVAAEAALERVDPARGVLRITRHPFLWAVMVWASVHALVNGNLASLTFFGSLFITAALGTRSIDRKRARSHPAEWELYRACTSNLPFAALLRGRNRLVWRELVLPFVLGGALTVLLLLVHRELFHVSPLP